MMCEECGVNPAVFHFVTIRNEEKTEQNLCAACMAITNGLTVEQLQRTVFPHPTVSEMLKEGIL